MPIHRHQIEVRPNWQQKVADLGLVYHTFEGKPYWDESVYYELSPDLVHSLYRAAKDLHDKSVEVCSKEIEQKNLDAWGLPGDVWDGVGLSWTRNDPSLYGRFDFAIGPDGVPKLLEYNADTPTALLEAAIVQDDWATEMLPGLRPANQIYDSLVSHLKKLASDLPAKLTFASEPFAEDWITIALLESSAKEAGFVTNLVQMDQIGWDARSHRFVSGQGEPIEACFKLYPWEYMLRERFGYSLLRYLDADGATLWLEPLWKFLLSSKRILASLWEYFPGHPNLLPCFWDGPRGMTEYAIKPYHSREGANITLVMKDETVEEGGDYADEQVVFQQYAQMEREEDKVTPVFGVWMVGGEPCGIGIRESESKITTNLSRFVPHVVP